jgi:hypothetical protein
MSRRKLQLQQKPTRHMLPPTAVSRNGFDWRLVMKPLAACRECKRLAGISAGLLGKIYCVVRMAFQAIAGDHYERVGITLSTLTAVENCLPKLETEGRVARTIIQSAERLPIDVVFPRPHYPIKSPLRWGCGGRLLPTDQTHGLSGMGIDPARGNR